MNWAQNDFYPKIWYFNVILKARQLGFTTEICLYILDSILFNSNKTAGIIAHNLDDTEKIFKNKVKYAYDNLPDEIRKMVPAVQDSAKSLTFGNGSSISVGTSMRGGTLQYLLVSEFGKISAKYPDKAKEIITGAINTLHEGSQSFFESTAEGQGGEFYELSQKARHLKESKAQLTRLDPRFHFYPWYKNPSYALPVTGTITQEIETYLDGLGVDLTPEQRFWYFKKQQAMGDLMLREFPSTPDESFQQSIEGTYYHKEMAWLRKNGRITTVPWIPNLQVDTWWDLGYNDDNTIVFTQRVGQAHHVIDYYENSLEGTAHYVRVVNDKPYIYNKHYWPHDGGHHDRHTGKTYKQLAIEMGLKPISIVTRTDDLQRDHEIVRNFLPQCWFDATKCDKLIKHLGNYRREWNERLAVWKDTRRHDEASHGADAFRTFAIGYREKYPEAYDRYDESDDWRSW